MTRISTESSRPPLLRRALLANAVFSGLSGLGLLAAAGPVGGWIGVTETWILRGIGAGLASFAAALVALARSDRPRPALVLAASGSDFAWVLGSGAVVAGFPELLTPAGDIAVVVVAVVVAALGCAQIVGLQRAEHG